MGYGNDLEPEQLIHALEDLRLASPKQAKSTPGYLTNANLSFTQLRRDAEAAIQVRNWEEAIGLLKLGVIMRPTHRNVARRLKAVQTGNRLIRSLLLIMSYRDVR